MEEHPVALEIYILSPNSWVTRRSIGGLGTACAGAGELKQGLLELAALNGVVDELLLLGDMIDSPVEGCLLRHSRRLRNHLDSSLFGRAVLERLVCDRAGLYAESAAHAVERADRNGELIVGLDDGLCGKCGALGSCCSLIRGHSERTDSSVRADECALITLDAVLGMPQRSGNGNAALLICSCALRELYRPPFRRMRKRGGCRRPSWRSDERCG